MLNEPTNDLPPTLTRDVFIHAEVVGWRPAGPNGGRRGASTSLSLGRRVPSTPPSMLNEPTNDLPPTLTRDS
jgi:hypothetical protein